MKTKPFGGYFEINSVNLTQGKRTFWRPLLLSIMCGLFLNQFNQVSQAQQAPTTAQDNLRDSLEPFKQADQLQTIQSIRSVDDLEELGSSQNSEGIEEITVQGKRLKKTPAALVKKFKLEPTKKALPETLSQEPGLAVVQEGGVGQKVSIFARGSNSDETLIYQDGFLMSNPGEISRSFDASLLNSGLLETVDVLYGPQSVKYGSNATSGIVVLKSKPIARQAQAKFYQATSSTPTFKEALLFSDSVDNYRARINLNRIDSKGISAAAQSRGVSEPDFYRSSKAQADAEVNVSSNALVSFGGEFEQSRGGLDQAPPHGSLLPTDDPNFEVKKQSTSGFVAGKWQTSSRWNQELKASYRQQRQRYDDQKDEAHPRLNYYNGITFIGETFQSRYDHEIQLTKGIELNTGLDHQTEQANHQNQKHAVSMGGVYAELMNENLYPLKATVGGRMDWKQSNNPVAVYRGRLETNFESYKPNLYVAVGSGVKQPTVFHLYGMYGNPSLKPEKNFSLETGYEQAMFNDRVNVSGNYFYKEYTDKIDWFHIVGNPNPGAGIYKNVGEKTETVLGLHGSVLVQASDRVLFSSAVTRIFNADQLDRRAGYKIDLGAFYNNKKSKLKAGLEFQYTGLRSDLKSTPQGAPQVLHPYRLLNSHVSYAWTPRVSSFVRFDNLLNEDYEVAAGYGAARLTGSFGLDVTL